MANQERPAPKRRAPWLVWTLPALLLIAAPMANHVFGWQIYRQPSGSMQPTLMPGQRLAAAKWAYGYTQRSFAPFTALAPEGRWLAREPRAGDVVVFEPIPEPGRAFVKRIVAMPGERVQMIDGVLHINGEAVRREPAGEVEIDDGYGGAQSIPAFTETLPNGVSYRVLDRMTGELDNTPELIVPDGHVFVLGDDRDNSADSRVPSVVGFVPIENLIGRVDAVF